MHILCTYTSQAAIYTNALRGHQANELEKDMLAVLHNNLVVLYSRERRVK